MSLLKGIIKWLFPVQVEQVMQEQVESTLTLEQQQQRSWVSFMKAVDEYNLKPENVNCQVIIKRWHNGDIV